MRLVVFSLCFFSLCFYASESIIPSCDSVVRYIPVPFEPKTLHEAVRWGTVDQVQSFLYSGANPNEWDERGRTALHYAVCRSPVSDNEQPLDVHKIPILFALIFAGANYLVQDFWDYTSVDDALILGDVVSLVCFMSYGLFFHEETKKKYPVILKAEKAVNAYTLCEVILIA